MGRFRPPLLRRVQPPLTDNTKIVIKACLYDPVINRTYADMAAHYGAAVLPARTYKLRAKAKVEVGVLIPSVGYSAGCNIRSSTAWPN